MRKLTAVTVLAMAAAVNAEIKREDYPTYTAYLNAVSESNAGTFEILDLSDLKMPMWMQ